MLELNNLGEYKLFLCLIKLLYLHYEIIILIGSVSLSSIYSKLVENKILSKSDIFEVKERGNIIKRERQHYEFLQFLKLTLQMSFLSGRKFLIIGGNGFVGNRVAAKLVKHGGHVSVLSRKGPRFQYPQNKKINWIIGSAMEPESIKDKINQADTVIHSLGTLVDTSVTKLRQPGSAGTYEQMNRDTFLNILKVLDSPKKIIYLSSANHPPFLPRYLSTKIECEQILFESNHDGYSIRPGFIYDLELKKWSLPLRYTIKAWNKVYPPILSITSNGTLLQKFVKQFEQAEPTSLNKIADAIAYISYKGFNKKILQNDDIINASELYQKIADESKSEKS